MYFSLFLFCFYDDSACKQKYKEDLRNEKRSNAEIVRLLLIQETNHFGYKFITSSGVYL